MFVKRIIVGLTTVISLGTGTISGLAASGTVDLTDENKTYSCNFLNYDDSLLYKCEVAPTHNAIYRGKTPTRPSDELFTYEFVGWDKPTSTIRKNEEFVAQYKKKYRDYETKFVNYDGEVLYTAFVQAGDPAFYAGDTPTRPDTEGSSFIFKGWDKSLDLPVYEDTTYVAEYRVEIKEFNVYFFDYDETTVLYVDKVGYGGQAVYQGPELEGPDAEDGYHYEFTSWSEPFNNVVEDMTTVAQYEKVKNKYDVTFKNWNDEILYVDSVEHGGTALYEGETPTKEPDGNKTYEFSGWDKSLFNIIEETTIHATFIESDPTFVVTFKNYDGEILDECEAEYNGTAAYSGETPEKPSTEKYNYVFKEWDRSLENVRQNYDTYAVFDEILKVFTVTYLNYDATELGTAEIPYGESAENAYDGPTPTRPEDDYYTYEFEGWDRDLSFVSEDTETYAKFRPIPKKTSVDGESTNGTGNGPGSGGGGSGSGGGGSSPDNDDGIPVYFKNYNNELLKKEGTLYGDTAVYTGPTPTRNSDLNYDNYQFCSWDKSIENVVKPFDTFAQYEIWDDYPIIKYIVSFRNVDNSLLYESVCEESDMPSYNGETPTVPETLAKGEEYVFCGWGGYYDEKPSPLKRVTTSTGSYTVYAKYKLASDEEMEISPIGGDIPPDYGDGSASQVVFEYTTEKEGPIYFRENSFGSFDPEYNSYEAAPTFVSEVTNEYSALNLTSDKLKQISATEYSIHISSKGALPYTLAPTYSTTYDRSDTDYYVAPPDNLDYDWNFIPIDLDNELLTTLKVAGYSSTEIRDLEKEYRSFVYDNYLDLPFDEQEYFEDLAAANSLSVDTADDILHVVEFISEWAEYSLNGTPYPEGFDNILYFMQYAREGKCIHFASALTAMFRSLGLPARYVVGYLSDSTSGETIEVTNKDAHAWTEIYINGVGWMIVDATPGNEGGMNPDGPDWGGGGDEPGPGGGGEPVVPSDKEYNPFGPVEGDPIFTIHVYPESESKTYDGEKMNVEYETTGSLYPGDILFINICEEATNAGSYVTRSKPRIYHGGTDVTENYVGKVEMIYENYVINRRPITITTASATKDFDGEELIKHEYSLTGTLVAGHILSMEFISSQLKPGSCDNRVTNITITDSDDFDVTRNYKINRVYGKLTVN